MWPYLYFYINILKLRIYGSDKVKIMKIQIIMRNAPVIFKGFSSHLIDKNTQETLWYICLKTHC